MQKSVVRKSKLTSIFCIYNSKYKDRINRSKNIFIEHDKQFNNEIHDRLLHAFDIASRYKNVTIEFKV